MLCYTCLKANLEKKLSWAANADAAFTDSGYTERCPCFMTHLVVTTKRS